MIQQLLFVQLAFVSYCVDVHSMELILTYKYLDSKWQTAVFLRYAYVLHVYSLTKPPLVV